MGNKHEQRKRFKNAGRPSGRKWLDQERGIAVNFMPKKGGKRGTVPVIVSTRAPDKGDGVECLECGARLSQLSKHINCIHKMSGAEYRAKHGADAPLVDTDHLVLYTQFCVDRGIRKHEKNISHCQVCGKPFRRGRSKNAPSEDDCGARRQHCSDTCLSVTMSKKATEQGTARMTFSPARLAYLENMKKEREARCTVACTVCGEPFQAPTLRHGQAARDRFRGTCSYACRSELRRRSA